jgi:hypothetical protein
LESVSSGIQQAWSLQKSQQRVQKKEQEQNSLMKPFYKGSVRHEFFIFPNPTGTATSSPTT